MNSEEYEDKVRRIAAGDPSLGKILAEESQASFHVDVFGKEIEMMGKAREVIGDLAVQLGEWESENYFGDPNLRPSMVFIHHAVGLLNAAGSMLKSAQEEILKI